MVNGCSTALTDTDTSVNVPDPLTKVIGSGQMRSVAE